MVSFKMGVKFATSLNTVKTYHRNCIPKYVEMQYLVIFHIKYTKFIKNKRILTQITQNYGHHYGQGLP